MRNGRRQIGYAKLGRSIDFNPTKHGFQGDAEAPNLLRRLAARNPDVDWIVVGRNSKERDIAPNVVNPWAERPTGHAWGFSDKLAAYVGTLDGVVMQHGQSGTSHHSIPQSNSTWAQYYDDPLSHATTPQDWGCQYAGFLIKGLNILGDRTTGRAPVVWLVPDPRNYVKARDLKWPTGCDDILAQYAYSREQRHERWLDPRTPAELGLGDWCRPERDGELWIARHTYRYGGLELMIVPDDWETWWRVGFAERASAGVGTTSFKDQLSQEPRRSELVSRYLLATWPDAEVCGKWDKESLKDVPPGTVRENPPTEFVDQLNRWRVTLALPALGTSWTAAKPYQCFAAGTVCFHVGRLDDQGWVLPSRRETSGTHVVGEINGIRYHSVRDDWTEQDVQLAAWLRVESVDEFAARSRVAATDEGVWTWLVTAQRDLLRRHWELHYVETEIERKLGLR